MARAILLVATALLFLAPAAEAATQRYATPGGAATGECPQNQPCDIYTVFMKAQANDEVIIGTGDYGSAAAPLPTPIVSTTAGLDVHGEDGKPRPRIFGMTGDNTTLLDLSGPGVKLRFLELRQLSVALHPAGLTFDGSQASDVIAITTGSEGRGCVLLGNSVLTNSVCEATGNQGHGIFPYRFTASPASNTSTIRNVTVIASGTSGIGIEAIGGSTVMDAQNLTVTNTIVVVPSNQAAIMATKQTGAAKITIDHSNFGFESHGSGNQGQIVKGAGNQQLVGAPKFVAPGDYHIAAGSITIDKGADDPLNGPNDVDGNPRTLGQSTDMGADEFVPPPAVTTGAAGSVTRSSADVHGTVNPERVGTSYHFEYGTTTAYGTSTAVNDAGAGSADLPAAATLTGLAAGTTYHYRLVAVSVGGTTAGGDMSFTTLPAPIPHFVGALKLSHTRFAAAKPKPPIGTKVTFTLDNPATVHFGVERATAGRRSGKLCVKATKKNRNAKKCTRYLRMSGGFDVVAGAGQHSFTFKGRLNGKRLGPGSYRMVAAISSGVRRAGFKIVRR
jgi:hypothetical protein